MNIPKYQQGGGFESLFTIYKPVQTETPRRAETSSRRSESKEKEDDSDKGKLTEKELFSMLKELDGLPNEMQQLVSNLTRSLRLAKALGEDDINDLATTYLTNLYKLKQAKYNRDLFKETYTRAVENDSLNDIAITTDGYVLALDKKTQQITPLKPEEWVQAKQSGEYQALTNSNLLWYRSQHPGYVNNNKIFQIVENGIGLEQVHQMIKDRFRDLGNTETSSTQYIPKDAVKGHEILEKMIQSGPEGYYKITQELTQTDQAQIDATLAYIYSTLPANAKVRLTLETNDGKPESAANIIKSMLFGTIKSKVKYSPQYVGTDEKLTGTKTEKDSDKMNIAEKLIAGYGALETFGINIGDSNLTIVTANTLPLVGKEDKDLGVRKPISDVMQSSLGRILNLQSASIGGQIISSFDLNRVITQDGKIRTIDFPCIQNENGTIVPNISPEVRQKKKEADEELRQMGININDKKQTESQYQTINQVYQKHKLDPPYSSSGKLNQKWARFAIMAVATDGDVVKGNTSLLQEVTDDYEAENIISAIQESDKNYNFSKGIFGLWGDSIYKGVMWVPIFESYNMASATDKISASDAMQKDIYDQAIQSRTQLTTEQIY